MTVKVIGAGFGRTGTASFKSALETLGFGPCYHMFELISHLDQLSVGGQHARDAGELESVCKATVLRPTGLPAIFTKPTCAPIPMPK